MAKLAIVGWLLMLWAAGAGAAVAENAASAEQAAAGLASSPDAPVPTPDLAGLPGETARALGGPDDGERTLHALPRNLVHGVVGVFSQDNLGPLLVGATASFTGAGFDHGAAGLIRNDCRVCGTTGATAGGVAVVPAIGALFLAGRLSSSGRFRAFSYDLAEAGIVDSVWTTALKYSTQRRRPDGGDRLSFPSGHTSAAFSMATVAERHYGWKVGLPAYAAAAFIGYSRIETNRHNLSDVLAGATLGVIVGRTVTRLNGAPTSRRTLAVGPATDANGRGLGLGVSASW